MDAQTTFNLIIGLWLVFLTTLSLGHFRLDTTRWKSVAAILDRIENTLDSIEDTLEDMGDEQGG